MEYCEGFKDWLMCLRCELLGRKGCPLEGENLAEGMRIRMLTEKGMLTDLDKEI